MGWSRLAKKAGEHAPSRKAHPEKIAPEPDLAPISKRTRSSQQSPKPSGAVDATPPRSTRAAFESEVDWQTLERRLAETSANIPRERVADLARAIEKRLGPSTLAKLSPGEMEELRALVRAEIALSSPGASRLQLQLMQETLMLDGVVSASHRIRAVDLPEGAWLYYYARDRNGSFIVEEAFVPRRPGGRPPMLRPDPTIPGLAGQPRWRHPDGSIRLEPPPTSPAPKRARSGLTGNALDEGTDVIFTEFQRAELRAQLAAERLNAPTTLNVRGARSGEATTRTGSRIHDIEYSSPDGPGRAWDRKVVIKTVTGPTAERIPDEVLHKELVPLGDAKFEGFARCHAVGPVLGDETFAGLAWCPHKAFNLLQLRTIEGFLRWGKHKGLPANIKAATPLTISVYIEHVEVNGVRQPFLRSAHYEFDTGDGTKATAILSIDANGKVETDMLSIQPL